MAGEERISSSTACQHLVSGLGKSGRRSRHRFGRISAGMEPDEVAESCMVATVRLLREYFWPHARAALRQIGLTDRHRHLRRALRQGQWLADNLAKGHPSRGLRRRPRCRTDSRFARSSCADGVVAPRENRHRGGPLERWHVDPAIFQTAETATTAENLQPLDEFSTLDWSFEWNRAGCRGRVPPEPDNLETRPPSACLRASKAVSTALAVHGTSHQDRKKSRSQRQMVKLGDHP
jgi:hypothetical protein